MKMRNMQTGPDTWDFTQADYIVNYGETHGLYVRGHTLVWYQSIPAWMEGQTFTRAELIAIMEEQITTVVSRYQGRIFAWDVVNEAILDDGSYRPNIYYDVIGPEYISLAFQFAQAADPSAKLYYNDYGSEGLSIKSNAIYAMVQGLVSNNVPIHGVGFQTHTNTNIGIILANVNQNIQRLAVLGLKTQFTEVDVSINTANDLSMELAKQAQVYGDIMTAVLASGNMTDSFLTWGITDKYTWLGTDKKPLLFDENYVEKQAYTEIVQTLLSV